MANSELGLLFKVKMDGSQSAAEITKLRALFASEFGQMGTLGTGALKGINTELTSLARSVPLVGQPLAGVTRAFLSMHTEVPKASGEIKTFTKGLGSLSEVTGRSKADITSFLTTFNTLKTDTEKVKTVVQEFGGEGLALIPKFEKVGAQLESVAAQTIATGSGFAAMAGPVGIAAGALLLVAGAGVAVGAGLFSLSKQAADYGEAIYKASQKTGLSAEFLSVAKVRAEETGGSFERLTTGLARFEVAVSKSLSNPSSEAAKAVNVLRLNLDQLKAATPDERVKQFGIALSKVADIAERNRILTDLGAKGFIDQGNAIIELTTHYGELEEKTKSLGLYFSGESARAARTFNIALRDLQLQASGLAITAGAQLIPAFNDLVNTFNTVSIGGHGLVEGVFKLIGETIEENTRKVKFLIASLTALAAFQNSNGATATAVFRSTLDSLNKPAALPSDTDKDNTDAFAAKREGFASQAAELRKQEHLAEEETRREYEKTTAAAKVAFETRAISEEAATTREIAAIQKRTTAQATEAQQLAGRARNLLQKTIDSDLPADQKSKEVETRLNDIKDFETRQKDVVSKGENEINQLRAKLQADQTKALENNLKNAEKVATDAEKLRIDKIAALGQQGLISATEAEKRRESIENGAITRQRSTLEIYKQLAGASESARAAVAAKAQALDAQASALAEEQKNRRIAAHKQEFEEEVRFRELQLQTQGQYLNRLATNLRAEAENGSRTFRDAETQIFAAEERYYEVEIKILTDRITNAMKIGNQKLTEELQERKALLEDQQGANRDAAKRTLGTPASLGTPAVAGTVDTKEEERNQQRAANLRSYYAGIAAIVRGGEALDLKEMERAGANRIAIIERQSKDERKALTDAYNLEVATLKGRLKLLSIDEATKKKNADEIKAIQDTLDALEKRLTKDTKAIDAEEKRAKERANPASRRSIMGDEYADMYAKTGSKLKALGATGKSVFEELSVGAGNMKSMLGDAFGSVAAGLGQMAEAFLVTGEFSGKALAKMLVQTLAHLAAESEVKALYEAAAGYASLAVLDAPAAALHFSSAGIFATIGGVAAGAALAGSFAAGTRGGNKNSAGTTAAGGRALGYGQGDGGANNAPVYAPFNYGGSTFSASQANGQGSRNTATASALNRVATALENHAQGQHALAGELSRLQSISPTSLMEKVAGDTSASYKAADAVHGAMKAWHPLTKAVAQISEGAGFD